MEFAQFNKMLQENFKTLVASGEKLFEVSVDKDQLWNLYLDSFPAGTNEIFRVRREFDCGCCRSFVKTIGNVVTITNNQMKTIWDFETNDPTYQPVINALSAYLRRKIVSDVFVCKLSAVGTKHSFEQTSENKVIEWNHFYLELPQNLIDKTSKSEGEIKGEYRDTRNVFKRSLEEITEESLLTVLELISQNSLYKGEEWLPVLNQFLQHQRAYSRLATQIEKDNYTWQQAGIVGGSLGRIKNHSIGTLLTNISEGMDLDTAVKKYEAIVAPSNYKRPKAIFTKKMLEDAQKTIETLGYADSLSRRYATLDDITVNNILFSNKDSAKRISGTDIFADMAGEISVDPKKFSKVEEISVDNFVTNVLPTAKELELFLENKHAENMVSLIAPENKDSKTMFKWNNGFSWAYTGNMTDSSMRDRVKDAGGRVDGVLRFTIQWNDIDKDINDLDAHCQEPKGKHIYFADRVNTVTQGNLDVDIRIPSAGKPAVENITWPSLKTMNEGIYRFWVHNYDNRGGKKGFRAEVEYDGQIFSFDYNKAVRQDEDVEVAYVTYSKKSGFSIQEKLPSSSSSRKIWNLSTNQFVPVTVAMYSPNYWDAQQGIGNRHFFFMLKDCINPESPNGFYNEFLKEELLKQKNVLEALGGKMSVKNVADQLSGVGFSSTKRNDVLVKVKGSTERVIRVKI